MSGIPFSGVGDGRCCRLAAVVSGTPSLGDDSLLTGLCTVTVILSSILAPRRDTGVDCGTATLVLSERPMSVFRATPECSACGYSEP